MAAPIASSLTPNQLRDRPAILLARLLGRATDGTPTNEGYRMGFAADDRDILNAIAACIDAERHCCPFVRFTLTVPAEGGRIELEVTGPAGTRRFLGALLEFSDRRRLPRRKKKQPTAPVPLSSSVYGKLGDQGS